MSLLSKVYSGELAPDASTPALFVTTLTGRRRLVRLDASGLTLGRMDSNTLSFPRDDGLSRQHLAVRADEDRWFVEDLGSKNGTFVNGEPVTGRCFLSPGDLIVAGEVTLTFLPSGADALSVSFEPALDASEPSTQSASLNQMPGFRPSEHGSISDAARVGGRGALWAFLRAGRELATRRSLPELFAATLELSLEAVGAERGALLTLDEGDRLVVQASRGGELRIGTSVRDRVLTEKVSLLVHDVPSVLDSETVLHQGVQSLIAAPLQTEDRVIGLVYVDSIDTQRTFAKEDLDLLTIMANVASIQIERERWEIQRQVLVSENVDRLGRLAAAVSHEINTPLGALKSTVDTLLKAAAKGRSASPEEQVRLESIQTDLKKSLDASLERMEQVIGRIQRFTNMDRGEVQSVDLNELVSDAVALASDPSVEIRVETEALPPVDCDRQSLSSSFASLLGLASETAQQPGASGTVAVSTHASETRCEVRIHVDGEGLAPEASHRLFEPTFGIAEGRISAGNWSLFTAQQVVQELGGQITVDSPPNQGTTFIVRLPRR